MKTLLTFGHGYTARALARRLIPDGWTVIGTTRSDGKFDEIKASGVEPILWPGGDGVSSSLRRATHVLVSTAPGEDGDPVLRTFGREIGHGKPEWVGYLSTTGVYGDHNGGWVDEDTPLAPTTKRGEQRATAEHMWTELAAHHGLRLEIFRLAGIYGQGRGPFEKVRKGTARRIVKPGQVFSRIHVDDIAQTLAASIASPFPTPGRTYNVCDDDPAPPQDVIAYAADLLGLPIPAEIAFEDAELSPMARSFYAESKRVRNDRIKRELGVKLLYPDYRSGLRALLAD